MFYPKRTLQMIKKKSILTLIFSSLLLSNLNAEIQNNELQNKEISNRGGQSKALKMKAQTT